MSIGLHIVPITKSVAPLGRWGKLVLTGRASATLRLTQSHDVELPEAVAKNLTSPTVRLLNDEMGRLLILPYDGELVVGYDLAAGEMLYSPIEVPRDPDHGMRAGGISFIADLGVAYMSETMLAFFHADCTLAWRRDGDFGGWDFEGTTLEEMHLVGGDSLGREMRETRSVADGRVLHHEVTGPRGWDGGPFRGIHGSGTD